MAALILPYGGVSPRIAEGVFIAPTAAVIGDVEIGEGSGIWFGVVVRGDVNKVRIGKGVNIQDGTIVHVASDEAGPKGALATVIGSAVTVGHAAIIHACTLKDGCFVGMGAVVMDGVVVESNAMVGAGAVVTPGKHIEAGQLWAGVPARYLRDLSAEEIERNAGTAPHYQELARQYLDSGL